MIRRKDQNNSIQYSLGLKFGSQVEENSSGSKGFIDLVVGLIFMIPFIIVLLVFLYFQYAPAINNVIGSAQISRHRSSCNDCRQIRKMLENPIVVDPFSQGKIDSYEVDSIEYYNAGLAVLEEVRSLIKQAEDGKCIGLGEFIESTSKTESIIRTKLEEATLANEHRDSCPDFQQAISLVKEAEEIQKSSTGYFITRGRRVAFCENGLNKLKQMETLLKNSKCDYCASEVGTKRYLDIGADVKAKLAQRINE